jgi:hypothetical protein
METLIEVLEFPWSSHGNSAALGPGQEPSQASQQQKPWSFRPETKPWDTLGPMVSFMVFSCLAVFHQGFHWKDVATKEWMFGCLSNLSSLSTTFWYILGRLDPQP